MSEAYKREQRSRPGRGYVWLLAAFCGLSGLACGGGNTPADNPDNPPPLDDGSGGSGSEPVAPASSEKVKQGMDLIQAQNFTEAKSVLEGAVKDNPKDPQAVFYLGVAHEGLGDKKQASEHYKKALELDAKLIEASVNLSAIMLDEQDAAGALAVIDGGLKNAPKHPGLLMNRALALEATGNKDEAAKAYGAAVDASPDNVELRYAYAEVLAGSGRTDQALEQLRKVGATDDPKLLAATATLFGKLKAYSDCVGVLDRAIKAKPSADLHVRRGVCRHDMKDDAGAKSDYDAAIKLDANFAPGYYYLGKHFRAKGDKKQALANLEKAVQLGADGPVGKAAQKEIDEMKGGGAAPKAAPPAGKAPAPKAPTAPKSQ
jgi:Flp pilus assembly protein TadD